MKILLIGSGGREHAIAKKLVESTRLKKLYILPGNGGTELLGENIQPDSHTPESIIEKSIELSADLIICGPEQPLVDGIADEAKKQNIPLFGPVQKAAMLEGSKIFAKEFMKKYNIPTAGFKVFTDFQQAKSFVQNTGNYPLVIKADGLAQGKGVLICQNEQQTLLGLEDLMLKDLMGGAGKKLIIEEYMQGIEMSFIGFMDTNYFSAMISARDYKRAFDGDKGKNTGGMGCYAPHELYNEELKKQVKLKIIDPLIQGLKKENILYQGIMYIGLMLTKEGPKVVEFNCRMGDPETQVVLPLLQTDIISIMESTMDNNLQKQEITWSRQHGACVVMASQGYPGPYEKNKKITFNTDPASFIHAGTKISNGQYYTNGGRVLNAVALGSTKQEALDNAYQLIQDVRFEGAFYRKDIGR